MAKEFNILLNDRLTVGNITVYDIPLREKFKFAKPFEILLRNAAMLTKMRHRLLSEMDNSLLSAYDNMTLDDLDYVITKEVSSCSM